MLSWKKKEPRAQNNMFDGAGKTLWPGGGGGASCSHPKVPIEVTRKVLPRVFSSKLSTRPCVSFPLLPVFVPIFPYVSLYFPVFAIFPDVSLNFQVVSCISLVSLYSAFRRQSQRHFAEPRCRRTQSLG